MVKVPTYTDRQVQIRPESTPRPQTDGREIGNALRGVGQILERNRQRMQEEDDAIEAKSAFTMLSDRSRDVLNGTKDAAGFYTKRGKHALEAYDSVEEGLDKIDKEIATTLKSPRASQAFEAMRSRKRERSSENISRHIARERQTYGDETDAAMIRSSLDDAAANYSDNRAVDDAILMGITAIRSNARGKGPEVVEMQEAGFISAARKAVIKAMAVDSPQAAQEYYKTHKKEIDGPSRPDIEKSLKSLVDTRISQENTDAIILKGGTLDEQLSDARKIKDPNIRDATASRIKVRFNEDKAARAEAERRQSDEFWSGFLTDPDIDKIPDDLPVATKKSAMVYASQMAKNAGNIKTDPKAYYQLSELLRRDQDSFNKTNLMQYASHLSGTDLKKFIDIQQKPTQYTKTLTAYQQAKNSLVLNEISDDEDQARFLMKYTADIDDFERLTGKAATPDDRQKIIDRLFTNVVTDIDLIFDDTDPLFKADQIEIPEDDLKEIKAQLPLMGLPVTDDNIREVYIRNRQLEQKK